MGLDRKVKVLVAGLGAAENVLLAGGSVSWAIILILVSAVAVLTAAMTDTLSLP